MKRTLILTLFLLTLLIPLSTRASDFAFKKFAPRPQRAELNPDAVILDFEGSLLERGTLSIDLESFYATAQDAQPTNFRRGLNPKNTC